MIVNDTKRDSWIMLCSHSPTNYSSGYLNNTVYSAVMLQAPLGILQRVTISQKIHISSHNALQNFITSTFSYVYSQVSNRRHPCQLILPKIFTQDILIPHPPLIKFQKKSQQGHLKICSSKQTSSILLNFLSTDFQPIFNTSSAAFLRIAKYKTCK